MNNKAFIFLKILLAIMLIFSNTVSAHENADIWPRTVLITNDNGIDDIKLIELARAFAPVAQTYVVAPLEDRSGSTHMLSFNSKGKLEVKSFSLGEGIRAFGVDGYPADCVILALAGIMRGNPPDIIISGINGGPNLGQDWIWSGTIGAARIGAYLGLPAIAVSGLDDDIPGAVKAATQWVVRLAKSDIVRELKPPQYLTVSIPRVPPNDIKGVRVAERAGLLARGVFDKTSNKDSLAHQEEWEFRAETANLIPPTSDVALYNSGYIVIVPMKADEHDYELLSRLKSSSEIFPDWPSKK
jgi:5'-nucleotidase